jgi:outer membrane protein assembly factor BamE (lipoprotein component of BamABCDE complex)
MKKFIPFLLAAVFIFAGCTTNETASQPKPTAQDNGKNPEVGMTRDQVVSLYGKTDNIRASSEGETWIYNLNMGEQFIPFNFGYRPKLRIIEFDKEGKVKGWSYSK